MKLFTMKNDTSICLYLPQALIDVLNLIPIEEGFRNRNEFIKWAIINQLNLLEKSKKEMGLSE
jgi:metal-responsive CopG/Arc/MetJ family transcriptional regulator